MVWEALVIWASSSHDKAADMMGRKNRPAPDFVRRAKDLRWTAEFIALLLAVVWIVAFSGQLSAAEEKKYPGLADGLETMAAFRGAHPKADDAYQKLVDRAPPDVRARVQASDWAERQRNMTAEQLDAAVEDPDMRIIPTADGLAVVPAEKMKNGINALTDFAIDQEETADFVRTARDRIPADRFGSPEGYEDFRDKAGKVAEHLDAMRQGGSGLYATGKRIAIKAIVSVAATAQIDELSGDIKNRVINEGAAKVLDDYRRAAEERKRKIAEQIEKAKAAEAERKRREAEEAAKTDAAADTAKEKAKNLDDLKTRISEALRDAEQKLTALDGPTSNCEQAAATAPDLAMPAGLDSWLANQRLVKKHWVEDAINQAQKVASGAEALKKFITQAEQAASGVCSDGKASSDPAPGQQLDSILAVARGARDGIKAQLDSSIAKLGTPVDRSKIQEFSTSLGKQRDYCVKNKETLSKDLASVQPLTDLMNAKTRAERLIWDADELSASDDLEMALMKSQMARLSKGVAELPDRLVNCSTKLRAARNACQEIMGGDEVAQLEKLASDLAELETRRTDALQTLTNARDALEQDYAAAKSAVARGKDCIGRPEDQQEACAPKEIEDAFAAANSDYYKENFAAARAALQNIQAKYGGCPGVSERVTKGGGIIDKVANAKTKIDSAIANCDVPKMESYIAQMQALSSPHPSMPAWIANMRAKLPQCQGTQVANADADCRGRDGSGFKASIQDDGSYYCVPDKSAADNWCQANHGSGWFAGPVSGTGTFDCNPGDQARGDECKKRHGSAARAGTLRKDGSYACYVPQQGTPRPRPTAKTPRTGPTAGEVIGGIIAEVIKTQTSKKKKPGKSTPGRRCHRRRDGTIHCGAG